MGIVGIHHAQITVPPDRVVEARNFYCGLLGLREIDKPSALRGRGGFWVQVGDLAVHVGLEEGVDRSRTKAHLAYQVDDLQKMRVRLDDYGIVSLESEPIPGFERFECRDPFGNRMEFIQPQP